LQRYHPAREYTFLPSFFSGTQLYGASWIRKNEDRATNQKYKLLIPILYYLDF